MGACRMESTSLANHRLWANLPQALPVRVLRLARCRQLLKVRPGRWRQVPWDCLMVASASRGPPSRSPIP